MFSIQENEEMLTSVGHETYQKMPEVDSQVPTSSKAVFIFLPPGSSDGCKLGCAQAQPRWGGKGLDLSSVSMAGRGLNRQFGCDP